MMAARYGGHKYEGDNVDTDRYHSCKATYRQNHKELYRVTVWRT